MLNVMERTKLANKVAISGIQGLSSKPTSLAHVINSKYK
jgi:hypothetical protein